MDWRLLPLSLIAACAPAPMIHNDPVVDTHSFSRPELVRVRHVELRLAIDFSAKELGGTARLLLERKDLFAPLRLDTKGLAIERVTGSDGKDRTHTLGKEDSILGQELTIELARTDAEVTVAYHTTKRAEALQWLAPAQTAGKKHPFLFTQGQAILTRTWIPLQDTPGNRITYEAWIQAPSELSVRMAAKEVGSAKDGRSHFQMDLAIPSYLIALACGDLEFRAISPRCGVYAEPSVIERASTELSDMETMVAAAEKLFGPYRWGRYDLLVLPPSFPFGGMENPCLTFATPTILAGDKSLVALVAHELAHSWSGNLVTNATWRDFWLNEGFTVYFEHRIMESIYGADRARMETLIGLMGLEDELKTLPPADQVLHIELWGRNPDDAMTAVAYDKGAWFLATCERLVGRARFDAFLTKWFEQHAFQSVHTADFEQFLADELYREPGELKRALQADKWIHSPGIPDNAVRPQSPLMAAVDAVLASKDALTPPAATTSGWVTQQWLRYLNGLPASITSAQMQALDATFHFTQSGNSEILCLWLQKSIRAGHAAADARLEEFLLTVGRRKFLKPLYEELVKTAAGKARAQEIYARARAGYHAVAVRTLDAIVLGK